MNRAPLPTGAPGVIRRGWQATPLGRFQPTAASDLRVHALLATLGGVVLATALQRVVTYRDLALPLPSDLLWPLVWARGLAWRPVAILLTVALLAAGIGAAVGYRHRPVRIAVAVVVTVYVASLSGFGKINHGLHHLVLAVVVLAAVPTLRPAGTAPPGRTVPLRAYDVVAAAQALVLVTYTMSGAAKLVAGVQQFLADEPGLFATGSLARLVAERMFQTGEDPPLAPFIIDHPTFGALLFGGTVVIELTAVAVLPFPRLAAVWAAVLAAFHMAVFWSMHINFSASIAVLVVLFGLSPFLAHPSLDDDDGHQGPAGPAGSLPRSDRRPTTG